MLAEQPLEFHWLAFDLLERAIGADPERAWQLVRAEARTAGDWITVDTLAHVAGRGILAEPYRWAELEQLVYSPSRWERRLVGSTVATIPFVDRTAGRTADVARHGLALVGDLIGDAEPDVQKALSWALRNLAAVDLPATVAFLRAETARAAATADGHRAWVIRDTFEKLPGARRCRARRRPRGHPQAPRRPIDIPRLGDRRRLPGPRRRHPAGRAPHRRPNLTTASPDPTDRRSSTT